MTSSFAKRFGWYAVMLAAIAVAIVALFAHPRVSRASSGTLCFWDGCVYFGVADGNWFGNGESAWLQATYQLGSAQAVLQAVYNSALTHAAASAQYGANGNMLQVACGNGVEATLVGHGNSATYCPDGTYAPNGDVTQCADYYFGGQDTAQDCRNSRECSGNNVVNGCSGAFIQTCPFGCASGACLTAPAQSTQTCSSNDICRGTDVYHQDQTCALSFVQHCDYGCANGACLPPPAQSSSCTPNYFCRADDVYYRNTSCSDSFIQHCQYGCLNGVCVGPPPPTVTFSVLPTLVAKSGTANVTWSSTNTSSCTVSGSNGDSWSGTSGTQTSGAVTGQTIYTLTCTGLDGSAPSKSVTVNIIPNMKEI